MLSLTELPIDFHAFGTFSDAPPLPSSSARPSSPIDRRSLWPAPKISTPISSCEISDITHNSVTNTPSNLRESSQLMECLSSPQGDLRRYVGRSFWALASNQMADCDVLLKAQQLRFLAQETHGRNSGEWARILESLPPRKVRDVLLESFLLSVKPLAPLTHVPTQL
ncbi:uncharacterized protein N7479_006618 [Penicillium vulpinum]|nr:uncharacterized protein N7479_006618 [Penicillium vulpinum]KAJ5959468.1 hypothetical protein N7479_006618 [Penicillium vulpinum]